MKKESVKSKRSQANIIVVVLIVIVVIIAFVILYNVVDITIKNSADKISIDPFLHGFNSQLTETLSNPPYCPSTGSQGGYYCLNRSCGGQGSCPNYPCFTFFNCMSGQQGYNFNPVCGYVEHQGNCITFTGKGGTCDTQGNCIIGYHQSCGGSADKNCYLCGSCQLAPTYPGDPNPPYWCDAVPDGKLTNLCDSTHSGGKCSSAPCTCSGGYCVPDSSKICTPNCDTCKLCNTDDNMDIEVLPSDTNQLSTIEIPVTYSGNNRNLEMFGIRITYKGSNAFFTAPEIYYGYHTLPEEVIKPDPSKINYFFLDNLILNNNKAKFLIKNIPEGRSFITFEIFFKDGFYTKKKIEIYKINNNEDIETIRTQETLNAKNIIDCYANPSKQGSSCESPYKSDISDKVKNKCNQNNLFTCSNGDCVIQDCNSIFSDSDFTSITGINIKRGQNTYGFTAYCLKNICTVLKEHNYMGYGLKEIEVVNKPFDPNVAVAGAYYYYGIFDADKIAFNIGHSDFKEYGCKSSTIVHELSHLYQFSLDNSFISSWKSIATRNGFNYGKKAILYKGRYLWISINGDLIPPPYGDLPKYGCIRAYGSYIYQEDIATFVETVYGNPSLFRDPLGPNSSDPDKSIYIDKLKLLYNRGFIGCVDYYNVLEKAGYDVNNLPSELNV